MEFFRAKELIYFGNKRIYPGKVFVIRPKKYFCNIDKEFKTMSVEDQFSSKSMEKVNSPKESSQPTNTNWENSEKERLEMADVAAQVEIDDITDARIKRENEEAEAIESVEAGEAPKPVTPVEGEGESSEVTVPNEEEEVI